MENNIKMLQVVTGTKLGWGESYGRLEQQNTRGGKINISKTKIFIFYVQQILNLFIQIKGNSINTCNFLIS